MSISHLSDAGKEIACLYDKNTETAFGPVICGDEACQLVEDFLHVTDTRHRDHAAIAAALEQWHALATKRECDGCMDEVYRLTWLTDDNSIACLCCQKCVDEYEREKAEDAADSAAHINWLHRNQQGGVYR